MKRARRLGAAALAVAALTGVMTGVVRWHARPAAAADLVEIHSAHGASYLPALAGTKPMVILALGSDARPGQDVERERADSIHLIGINPSHTRATILGFPRDSWVPIPGHGSSKINDAMAFGGPSLMVATIENLTGIHVDFWLLTSFTTITRMVNAIGGLTVNVPYPMHDIYSHANFDRAGPTHMSGSQVLAFSRNRHDTPAGDFSRSSNQGRVFLAALSGLRTTFAKQPAAIFGWIAALWQNVVTNLPPSALFDLGVAAARIDPSKVDNLVIPGSTGTVGAASVVFVGGSASSLFADMRADGVVG